MTRTACSPSTFGAIHVCEIRLTADRQEWAINSLTSWWSSRGKSICFRSLERFQLIGSEWRRDRPSLCPKLHRWVVVVRVTSLDFKHVEQVTDHDFCQWCVLLFFTYVTNYLNRCVLWSFSSLSPPPPPSSSSSLSPLVSSSSFLFLHLFLHHLRFVLCDVGWWVGGWVGVGGWTRGCGVRGLQYYVHVFFF